MSDPLFTAGTIPSDLNQEKPMKLVFEGKGTLKIRNGGFLSIFNRTTSRDFHDTLDLGAANKGIDRVLLTSPIPVVASGSFSGGVLDLSLKVLGFASIPIFHKQIAQPGDSIPIKWSVNGSTLVGKVTVVG